MMNKAQADVVYGFVGIRRSDPDYTAILGDEQRARPVRDWRPARRQHSRAAGHGVLRVQLARRDVRAGPVLDSRRRLGGQRRKDDRVDRRRAGGGPREGLHRAGDRRVEELHDRRDAAPARDQRGDRGVPADRRHVRSRPRLRRAAAGIDRRDHEGRRRRRGTAAARSRARDHRRRRSVESASSPPPATAASAGETFNS